MDLSAYKNRIVYFIHQEYLAIQVVWMVIALLMVQYVKEWNNVQMQIKINKLAWNIQIVAIIRIINVSNFHVRQHVDRFINIIPHFQQFARRLIVNAYKQMVINYHRNNVIKIAFTHISGIHRWTGVRRVTQATRTMIQ